MLINYGINEKRRIGNRLYSLNDRGDIIRTKLIARIIVRTRRWPTIRLRFKGLVALVNRRPSKRKRNFGWISEHFLK